MDSSEKLVASVGIDQVIRIWDRKTGVNIAEFKDPPTGVRLALNTDGTILACDQSVGFTLYEVPSGKVLAAERKRSPTACLAFSPDGRLLAVGDDTGTIKLWSVPAAWRKKK
jgi:WD40 repeat protein